MTDVQFESLIRKQAQTLEQQGQILALLHRLHETMIEMEVRLRALESTIERKERDR